MLPEAKPNLKVFLFQVERHVLSNHGAAVGRRATGDGAPEIGDLFQMLGPVRDVLGEDGPEHLMLADIRIEMVQKLQQCRAPTQAVQETIIHTYLIDAPKILLFNFFR
jgi:hypothetical protein